MPPTSIPRGCTQYSSRAARRISRVEVPSGRYLVFLAPNEPGAPNIYGAYTEYSLCAPHDADGKCEDHALVSVP